MLPNLRLLITATLSAFLLTAAAGLFVSLRLGHEPLTMRGDARPAFDESSINRISLSWSRPESPESAVEPAKPEPQLASRSKEVAEPQIAPAPPVEELQIASRAAAGSQPATLLVPVEIPDINNGKDQQPLARAPEVTSAIGEPAQSIPAAGAGGKLASLPHDSIRQVGKAKSTKRVVQRNRARTPRIARQFPLLAPRAGAKFNTGTPFLFFGPPSSP
jgi:hypothetical protein